MPSTTPCRSYPYPLDPDPPNVAHDIELLAKQVDTDICTLAANLASAISVGLNAVAKTGDAMTGSLVISSTAANQLALRRSGTSVDQPTISFQSLAGSPQFGTIMGGSGGLNYKVDSTADSHTMLVGTIERMVVDAGGATVTGTLAAKGAVQSWNTGGNQVALVDSNSGDNCWLSFYGRGTSTTTGTRTGFVGYNAAATLYLSNDLLNGAIQIRTEGSGDIILDAGASGGAVDIRPAGTTQMMVTGSSVLIGKSASDLAVSGIEMFGSGSSAEGAVRSTVSLASIANLYVRRQGTAATADAQPFMQFQNAATTVSSITFDTATTPDGIIINNCTTTAPSDYRLKDVIGPITDALERVTELRPIEYTWKAVPDGRPLEGFLAHEVADVVPGAVRGRKDGDEMQQLAEAKLVPLLTAAIIELLARVETLEAALGTL